MNKLTILAVFVMFFVGEKTMEAQVGINTESPRATLEVAKNLKLSKTTPQGVLFPQFTTNERDKFIGMEKVLMIFNTDTRTIDLYNGEKWISLKYKEDSKNKVSSK